MVLPMDLRHGRAMVVDATDPVLQVFYIVGCLHGLGGRRQWQQWPTVVQQCHGGGCNTMMAS
eukprot:9135578-Ditylum_brightwellii.AAC.2